MRNVLCLHRTALTAVLLILFFQLFPVAGNEAAKPKRILYINSFCIATPFAHEIMLGFQEYLSANNVLAHHEYRELDVCGTPNLVTDPERVKNIQRLLDKETFDLIVTNGNEAAHLFTEGRLKTGNSHTQLIMVNLYDNILQTTPVNIPTTGVIAIYRPYALMELAVKLKPDTGRIVIITGAMDDSREYMKRLKDNRKSAPEVNIEIISGQNHSYREMIRQLEAMPANTVLIFHSWNSIKDSNSDGGSFIEDLSHKFKGLILAGKESYMRRGAAGGLMITGREFGQQAGKLAIRIFNGESASTIPFTNITPRPALEYSALKKYGIDKKNVPPEIILLNAPDNILVNHWKEALAILVVVLLILQIFIMKLYYYRRMTRQLKKSEVRYQNNEKMLNTIMDNLPGMLFVKNIDDNFRYIAANSSFLEMVRCTREETIGHLDEEIFSHTPGVADKFRQDDRTIVESGKSMDTVETVFNGKKSYTLRTIKTIVHQENGPRLLIGMSVDMSKQVKLEKERKEHEKKLKKALEAAQQAERAKSMFLATMSHEIRTSLNAIIGFSDILNSTELPQSEQQANIRAIRFAGNALLSLINDILDLSKLEAEQMVLVMQKCNFAEQLHGISAIFQEKLRAKGLVYQEIVPENMPTVEVDIMRIRQILLNLIGNAVKFSDKGTISAIVEFEPDNDASGTLRVKVKDSGCGIREDFRDKIFQPFGQQDVIRDSHVHNGTGLGLPISLRLARRMGGNLYLESTGESGSVFVLELPGVRYYRQEILPSDTSVQKKIAVNLSNKKILIADDVPLNLKVLSSLLKKLGMTPIEANSGAEALELLKNGCNPDMVLTDMWMPGMNGTELAWKIHLLPEYARLPIIVLTADVEVSQSFPMEHFSGKLIKPLTLEKLRQVLETVSG